MKLNLHIGLFYINLFLPYFYGCFALSLLAFILLCIEPVHLDKPAGITLCEVGFLSVQ